MHAGENRIEYDEVRNAAGHWQRASAASVMEAAAKGRALKELLTWMVTSGQSDVAAFGCAPLPGKVAKDALKTIATLE